MAERVIFFDGVCSFCSLTGLWPLRVAFIVVPAPLRNLVYRFIANNR